MKKKKSTLMSFGKHLTSTISVGLVLFILGIVGVLGTIARNVTDTIKENLGFQIIMTDAATADDINAIKQALNASGKISDYEYLSADEILRQEEEVVGGDIVEMLGVNPYCPEFNVHVKSDYASTDSITVISAPIARMNNVDEVVLHKEMVDEVNSTIGSASLIFLAVAAALLLISFVLINNTVRLTIYSRRFLLHTMQLVGATAAFIRRPIIISNILNGLLAAAIAIGLLCLLRVYLPDFMPDVAVALPWSELLPIFGAIVIGGMIICGFASLLATNKYLRQNYDDLF